LHNGGGERERGKVSARGKLGEYNVGAFLKERRVYTGLARGEKLSNQENRERGGSE